MVIQYMYMKDNLESNINKNTQEIKRSQINNYTNANDFKKEI